MNLKTVEASTGGDDYKAQYLREVNACSNRILDKLGVRRELKSVTLGAPKATADYTSHERKGLEELVWEHVSDAYNVLFTASIVGGTNYSGLRADGSVFLVAGESNIPKDGTLLFTGKLVPLEWYGKPAGELMGYEPEGVSEPNISIPFFSAIALRARALNDAEKNAIAAAENLGKVNSIMAHPTKPFDFGGLSAEKRRSIARLLEVRALGALPAVLVNYWNGQAMPMQLYVSKGGDGGYCVVDPLTETRGMGENIQEAILDLARSGAYPECAIYYKGFEWNLFTNRFKPDVHVANATMGSWAKFANTTDSVMEGVGYSALAMSATGVGEIPAAFAGFVSTGWFGVRAVEGYMGNYNHKKIVFDPKNPQDWLGAGSLLLTVATKNKFGTRTRAAGGVLTIGAKNIGDFGQMLEATSKMSQEDATNAWRKFWLKNVGQLALDVFSVRKGA